MKNTEMIVSPEKMLDNPMYDSNDFMTSYSYLSHNETTQQRGQASSNNRAIYATPHYSSPGYASHTIDNPLYGNRTTSSDNEESHYVQNPIYGDPMDQGEQASMAMDEIYIIPQSPRAYGADRGVPPESITPIEMKKTSNAAAASTAGLHTYAVVDKTKKRNHQNWANKQPLMPTPKAHFDTSSDDAYEQLHIHSHVQPHDQIMLSEVKGLGDNYETLQY